MPELIHPDASLDRKAGAAFALEDCEDFIGLAEQLMDGHHAGVLTTLDDEGRPHSRWMGTFSFREFPRFHALTSPQSAKVEQIRKNPAVEWMLSNQDLSLVLNLRGHARILQDTASIKRAWKAIEDKTHAFFLQAYNEKPGMVVIETVVDRIECTVPRENLKWPVSIESFRHTLVMPTVGHALAQAKNPPLSLDDALCQQVEQLATGADIHESRNLIGAYQAAVGAYQQGDIGMQAVAHDAGRALRRLLTRMRLAHYARPRNE
jgi:general stress protein 26